MGQAAGKWAGAALVAALGAGCGGEPAAPASEPSRRQAQILYVLHPGRVAPGHPVRIRAGVQLGPDLCWRLERASVELRGYTIVVSATAVYAPDSLVACPTAIAFDTFTVTLPALRETTRYDFVAGSLTDDIWVHPDYAEDPEPTMLIARGGICPPHIIGVGRCVRFRCLHPALVSSGPIVQNWPALTSCASVRLYARLFAGIVSGCSLTPSEGSFLVFLRMLPDSP